MIEETAQRMDESLFSVADLKRALPRQVHHESLMNVLAYLEESGKIVTTVRGMSWIASTPALKRLLAQSQSVSRSDLVRLKRSGTSTTRHSSQRSAQKLRA
jgi:hypothetical protein